MRVKGFFFIDDGVKRLFESREELVKSAWDNRMPRSLDVDFRKPQSIKARSCMSFAEGRARQ